MALIAVAACEPGEPEETSTKILVQSGSDQLVLDEQYGHSFPDAMVNFVLHAERGGGSHLVLRGSTQSDLRVGATRLADGHLAWAVRDVVCEELSATSVACNDFVDLDCDPAPCCEWLSGWTTCACGLSSPDPRIADALRWVARDANQDARLRDGAVLALARTGARSEAMRIAKTIPADVPSIWILAARHDRADLDELRALRARGSRCLIEQIDHACGSACQ